MRSSDIRDILDGELSNSDIDNPDDDFDLGQQLSDQESLQDFSSGSGDEFQPDWNDLESSDNDVSDEEHNDNNISLPSTSTSHNNSTRPRPKKKVCYGSEHTPRAREGH